MQRRQSSSTLCFLEQRNLGRGAAICPNPVVKRTAVRIYRLNLVPPNKSLKLTESTVDDFAARQYAENDMINRYVRATNYTAPAVRRRSLAPVR